MRAVRRSGREALRAGAREASVRTKPGRREAYGQRRCSCLRSPPSRSAPSTPRRRRRAQTFSKTSGMSGVVDVRLGWSTSDHKAKGGGEIAWGGRTDEDALPTAHMDDLGQRLIC